MMSRSTCHTHNNRTAVHEMSGEARDRLSRKAGTGHTIHNKLLTVCKHFDFYEATVLPYAPSRRWSNTSLSARSNAAFVRLSSCVTSASSASFFDCETPESDSCSRRQGKQQQRQQRQQRRRREGERERESEREGGGSRATKRTTMKNHDEKTIHISKGDSAVRP